MDTPQEFTAISKAVADPLRTSILRALARDSFGVLELCRVFDVAQPALSHHLKLLLNAGLVAKRREGNSIFYRRAATHPLGLSNYVTTIFETLDGLPTDPNLDAGITSVHRERTRSSEVFFADNAERFQNQQALICEPATYASAAIELLDDLPRSARVLEVGPGDGDLLIQLARQCSHVHAIDNVPAMLERTRERIAAEALSNVTLELADFAEHDLADYQLIVASMVVHHAPSPAAFFRHTARLLPESGALLVIELCEHDQDWVKDACGDLWLGFEPEELDDWAISAGLAPMASQYLAQRNGFRIQLRKYCKSTLRSPS
jgi:DNA-binding transcriptional ArsR family regulator/cyclopropane fatty-acyl-phospholipid synthase-like methyltransferase